MIEQIKEATISDMVACVLIPVIAQFKVKEQRSKMKLRREKAIIAPDDLSGGMKNL